VAVGVVQLHPLRTLEICAQHAETGPVEGCRLGRVVVLHCELQTANTSCRVNVVVYLLYGLYVDVFDPRLSSAVVSSDDCDPVYGVVAQPQKVDLRLFVCWKVKMLSSHYSDRSSE